MRNEAIKRKGCVGLVVGGDENMEEKLMAW
jgi:hypothetical protein